VPFFLERERDRISKESNESLSRTTHVLSRSISSFHTKIDPADTIEIHACDRSIAIISYICIKYKTMSTYIIPKLSSHVYPNKDYDSLATVHASLQDVDAETIPTMTTTHFSSRLRFVGVLVSSAASLPHDSSDDTKSGLAQRT
jgi:hypothetical protein